MLRYLLPTIVFALWGAAGLFGQGNAEQSNAAANLLSPTEQKAGWQLLFDGQSGAGWHEAGAPGFPPSWRIKDGCLEPLAGLPVFQDLVTDALFTNFELQFRFRLASGVNGGVKYAIAKFDRWRPKGVAPEVTGQHARARGPEFQLVDTVQQAQMTANQKAGSLYGHVAPAPVIDLEAGTIHQAKIVKQGTHIAHWLDGVRVVDTDLAGLTIKEAETFTDRPSPIALQNHANKLPAGQAAACYFDIRILSKP